MKLTLSDLVRADKMSVMGTHCPVQGAELENCFGACFWGLAASDYLDLTFLHIVCVCFSPLLC